MFSSQKERQSNQEFDPYEPFVRCYKLKSSIKKEKKQLLSKYNTEAKDFKETSRSVNQMNEGLVVPSFSSKMSSLFEKKQFSSDELSDKRLNTERVETKEYVFQRNSMLRQPPSIHDHHMRNAFLRDFKQESILQLEKNILREILTERAQMNVIIKKSNP